MGFVCVLGIHEFNWNISKVPWFLNLSMALMNQDGAWWYQDEKDSFCV